MRILADFAAAELPRLIATRCSNQLDACVSRLDAYGENLKSGNMLGSTDGLLVHREKTYSQGFRQAAEHHGGSVPPGDTAGFLYQVYAAGSVAARSRRHWSERSVQVGIPDRSEEHTSELQSRENLVCRLLLEKQYIVNNVETN